ncbi:hypothetical protein F5Y16DRAFT_401562 [Xylariaceae sp. FL0255]|nr:hypothetical protein F5Y16DRAFT_401562 [Xylariaceae sp. FL0255]
MALGTILKSPHDLTSPLTICQVDEKVAKRPTEEVRDAMIRHLSSEGNISKARQLLGEWLSLSLPLTSKGANEEEIERSNKQAATALMDAHFVTASEISMPIEKTLKENLRKALRKRKVAEVLEQDKDKAAKDEDLYLYIIVGVASYTNTKSWSAQSSYQDKSVRSRMSIRPGGALSSESNPEGPEVLDFAYRVRKFVWRWENPWEARGVSEEFYETQQDLELELEERCGWPATMAGPELEDEGPMVVEYCRGDQRIKELPPLWFLKSDVE